MVRDGCDLAGIVGGKGMGQIRVEAREFWMSCKKDRQLQTVILLFWKRDTNLVDFTNNN